MNVMLHTSRSVVTSPFWECFACVCRLGGEGCAEVYGTGVHPSESEQDTHQQAIPAEPHDRPEGAQATRSF